MISSPVLTFRQNALGLKKQQQTNMSLNITDLLGVELNGDFFMIKYLTK